MNWNDVRVELGRRFQIVRDEPTWIVIAWRPAGTDTELQQAVQISTVEAAGETWLSLVAGVGEDGELDAAAALAHNGNLLVGALCWLAGCYVLRHLAPLASLDAVSLARAVDMVAHEAARLRHFPILRPALCTTPFVNFAE